MSIPIPRPAVATVQERSGVLRRWYDLLLQNEGDIAQLVACEAVSIHTYTLLRLAYKIMSVCRASH